MINSLNGTLYGTTGVNSVSGTLACCCHLFIQWLANQLMRPGQLIVSAYQPSSLINPKHTRTTHTLAEAIRTRTELAFEEDLSSRESVISAMGIYPHRLLTVCTHTLFKLRILKGIIPLSPAEQSHGRCGCKNILRASAERRFCERDRYPNGLRQCFFRWLGCSSIEPDPKGSPINSFCTDKLGCRIQKLPALHTHR